MPKQERSLRMSSSSFLKALDSQVLLADGGLGTLIQARDWDIDLDFKGMENCSEILCETRPDFVEWVQANTLKQALMLWKLIRLVPIVLC